MKTNNSIWGGGVMMLLNSIMVILLSVVFVPKSQAEELTHQDIVCALTGECASPFVDRRVRGVTTPVAPRPPLSFDATINFAFDSAELTPDAKKELDNIVDVLKDTKRLTATGYGKSKLLLPKMPFNALNRRVEFRNVKGVAPTETITPVTGEG